MEFDLNKLKETGIFKNIDEKTHLWTREIYFYINKNSWCEGLKAVINLALQENLVYLLLETDDNIHKKGEIIIAAFVTVSEFKTNFTLIENCIGYEKRTNS